ncbi:hypothetical protein D3C80_1470470 [compost metagenome]
MLRRSTISGADALAPLYPGPEIRKARARQLLFQNIEKFTQIGSHPQVRLKGGLGQLGRIDIHLRDPRVLGEGVPVVAGLTDVQPGTQYEDEVGSLQAEIARSSTYGPRPTGEQGMIRSNQIVRPGGGQWNTVALD